MGFQSKTYSLSDEVVAAIEAARAEGLTPNKFLRRVLGIDEKQAVGKGTIQDHLRRERLKVAKGDKTR